MPQLWPRVLAVSAAFSFNTDSEIGKEEGCWGNAGILVPQDKELAFADNLWCANTNLKLTGAQWVRELTSQDLHRSLLICQTQCSWIPPLPVGRHIVHTQTVCCANVQSPRGSKQLQEYWAAGLQHNDVCVSLVSDWKERVVPIP